jgi:hypothetical protein
VGVGSIPHHVLAKVNKDEDLASLIGGSKVAYAKHSSDILSIRFKHTCILRIFGFLKKYLKILYTKANFQTFVFL